MSKAQQYQDYAAQWANEANRLHRAQDITNAERCFQVALHYLDKAQIAARQRR
jgi:hypothetical protein